ncbi:unnamed protein product [Linum tenue]|uniref:Gnk2-homologous domain-containing protein n=2 Tax=Linum tenue TaxID=586396 RepID=A0AAV0QTX1_9ROSI|nr:unnamed protein product [Linum tenue]
MAAKTTRTLPILLLSLLLLASGGASTPIDTFLFGGCSQLKYTPGSPYESSLNSLLTSLVNSAPFSLYNNFTSQSLPPYSSSAAPTLYGLYQCRGDLTPPDCRSCVARAVTQLATLCPDATGGALQLDACFVRYDNASFLGVQDKSVVMKKCGASLGYGPGASARRDAVLDYVAGSGGGGAYYKAYRVGGSGDVYAVAQCVQDLSGSQCQDCVAEAVGLLKSNCAAAAWGDVFLGKCYARFSEGGAHSGSGGHGENNDDEIEKTLAILIGLIAGVALLIVFLSFIAKLCAKGKGTTFFSYSSLSLLFSNMLPFPFFSLSL